MAAAPRRRGGYAPWPRAAKAAATTAWACSGMAVLARGALPAGLADALVDALAALAAAPENTHLCLPPDEDALAAAPDSRQRPWRRVQQPPCI